jgi:hypothetical protein
MSFPSLETGQLTVDGNIYLNGQLNQNSNSKASVQVTIYRDSDNTAIGAQTDSTLVLSKIDTQVTGFVSINSNSAIYTLSNVETTYSFRGKDAPHSQNVVPVGFRPKTLVAYGTVYIKGAAQAGNFIVYSDGRIKLTNFGGTNINGPDFCTQPGAFSYSWDTAV